MPVQPDAEQDVQQAAAASLRTFLPRAFRRPVTDQEIDEYLSLFQVAYQEDGSFEQAIQYALQGVLLSPKFLFRWETPPRSPEMVPLDDFELASRLSYFLWASMPDDRLLELAGKGELSQDDVLRAEVLRMLGVAKNPNEQERIPNCRLRSKLYRTMAGNASTRTRIQARP
ncbi:MAG: DUF1595 domain-containing protein [Pirellulaceae bacterium]